MSGARFGDTTDYIRRQRRAATERMVVNLCSECGGKWWPAGKRYWHKAGCAAFKQQSHAEQDREAAVLRDASAPVIVRSDCGCPEGERHYWGCIDNPYNNDKYLYVNEVEGP